MMLYVISIDGILFSNCEFDIKNCGNIFKKSSDAFQKMQFTYF